MTCHGLVDRFRLDHPGREMWTWLNSSPSAKVGSYLDRVLVRRADIDFVSCPTFHLIAWTDHKLIRVSLRLVNRPSLAGYWKFNTSLLEIRDFRDRLESLIQRALVGAVTRNRWWASLKHRIRDFATKYGRQLNLDRTAEAKSIDDRLSRAVAGGDSLGVELARRDLERESSECCKGSVVRSRLKRVLNKAVKSNATAREEEVRRFPDWYIASVKTPDGRLLRSGRQIHDAFRAHFLDRFARCTDLPLREFHSYLADFPRLGAAEAASCKGVVTECEVRDALKQVGLNKSPGLDGLPYEVYLRMSHMFVPILTDMFNHRFAQGAIPGSVTKGVITLLKKGGRHVWEGLDDYRPITLLNTELKILARVLANRLQLVISDLIGPEQTFAVKGRSIQNNLHLIREVLEGIKDDTESTLISLDQSIGSWRLFWRLPDSNQSSADGLVWCTTTLRQWCKWTEGIRGWSWSSDRSGRAAPCLLFSMSSRWSPSCAGLGMRGQVRHCAVSDSLAALRLGFPRSLMTSQSLYPASRI